MNETPNIAKSYEFRCQFNWFTNGNIELDRNKLK